jgi:hypothetical protein
MFNTINSGDGNSKERKPGAAGSIRFVARMSGVTGQERVSQCLGNSTQVLYQWAVETLSKLTEKQKETAVVAISEFIEVPVVKIGFTPHELERAKQHGVEAVPTISHDRETLQAIKKALMERDVERGTVEV